MADHAFATQEAVPAVAMQAVTPAATPAQASLPKAEPQTVVASDQVLQQTAELLEKELREAKAKEASESQVNSKEST